MMATPTGTVTVEKVEQACCVRKTRLSLRNGKRQEEGEHESKPASVAAEKAAVVLQPP